MDDRLKAWRMRVGSRGPAASRETRAWVRGRRTAATLFLRSPQDDEPTLDVEQMHDLLAKA
eukprot:1452262-Alexandrium_andersonii.AAC.1